MPDRREFLTSAAFAMGSSKFLSFEEADTQPSGLFTDLPKQFSLAERDQRWTRVRAMMRERGFDGLLTPFGDGETSADSRYLTQLNGWTIFPLDGPLVAIVDGGDRSFRPPVDPWITDVRTADDGKWSRAIVDALRTARLQAARIGVGRLADVARNLEGEISFTTLQRLREALPQARFESATDPLVRVKLRRSAEEIAAMEKATTAGERAIQVMVETTRPGAVHKDVWLAMFSALTGSTGETPSRLAIRAGNEANTSTGGPMLETLQAGQIMNQEIAGRVLGYMAQVNQSICVGGKPPDDWADAAKYCIDVFHELVDWVKPGRRFMDLCERYVQRAKSRSPEISPTWVLVHTCGFGDGPRMGFTRTETPDLMIEPSMVFTLKPRIPIKGVRPAAQFGDPILVTETGARRLGTRKLTPVTAGT